MMLNFLKNYLFLFSFFIFIILPSQQIQGQDCSELLRRHRQAVVSLTVEFQNNETGAIATSYGTGFIITSEGYVLTAKHVVTSSENNYVIRSIKGAIGDLDATPQGLDYVDIVESQNIDIALLQFKDTGKQYSTVLIGKSRGLDEGQKLCSLSFSAPLGDDYHLTEGILSNKQGELWTTRMESNKGESGAPVFRASTGRVVALKLGTNMRQNVNFQAEPVNYLTPVHLANSLRINYFSDIDFTDDPLPVPKPPLSITSMKITYITGNNKKERDSEVTTVLELNGQVVGRVDTKVGFNDEWRKGKNVTKEINLNSPILASQCGGLKIKVNKTGMSRWDVTFSVEGKLSDGRTVSLVERNNIYTLIGANGNFDDAVKSIQCPLM
jgi:hypothetical protein